MFWMLYTFLVLYLIIGYEASISCTGKSTFCIKNDENCFLTCKSETNVTLVREEDKCSSPNVLYTNTTGNLVRVNASTSEEATYSCCKNKEWICSSSVIVSHEVTDVTCIWDLKNDTVLTCSMAGTPDDEISKKFQYSMVINHLPFRLFDKACDAISKFVFYCPLEDGYHDSELYIYVTMVAESDNSVNSEEDFVIIPIAKHKELLIEFDNITSETCTLKPTLPDDWKVFFDICTSTCNITIEISYTNIVTKNNFIETHNRTTVKKHVPSINMTNLRPNTLHNIDIKWKRVGDVIWSHIATLNFTTKIGVPKTSPLILNKAKGKEFVGIYIQKRSEDYYYGPISLILNKTTKSADGQRSRRSLPETQHLNFSQTVFVEYNEAKNESITLQYATSAGISSENSEVFISPQQEIQNVKRLSVVRYNRTHDSLTIDNIDGVDRLHYYWCHGEYLEEKKLVDCKSIWHMEVKDVKNTSYVKRPTSDANETCTNCQLHYGVAIQQLKKKSPILWDSASEPLIDPVIEKTVEAVSYLFILIGIVALGVIIVLVCWCRKQSKKVPQPVWLGTKIENEPYDYPETYNKLEESSGSSESESNRTTSTNTSDDSSGPVINIVIDTDTSNSDPYPKEKREKEKGGSEMAGAANC